MIAKAALALFLTFLVLIVVLADRGQMPEALSFYQKIPFGDTLGHFCLMGVFSFLATWVSKAKSFSIANLRIPVGAALVLVVVCLEETSQIFIPGRTFSLLDLAADFLGIFAFGWLALRFYPINRTKCAGQDATTNA